MTDPNDLGPFVLVEELDPDQQSDIDQNQDEEGYQPSEEPTEEDEFAPYLDFPEDTEDEFDPLPLDRVNPITFRPGNEDHYVYPPRQILRAQDMDVFWLHVHMEGTYVGELQILGKMIEEMQRAISDPGQSNVTHATELYDNHSGSGVWWRLFSNDNIDDARDLYGLALLQMQERLDEVVRLGTDDLPHFHPAQHVR